MYRSKKDVDKYVENLQNKLPVKEFKSRAFSLARLYYDLGDYTSCQKYVEQYLTQKDNNAAAYKLLAQALRMQGIKDRALDYYKMSLEIDPSQTNTILDICELLADGEDIPIEPGCAKYWCEKAQATFPKHQVTFRLREKLVKLSNTDPEALVNLLKSELAERPKDPSLHARLIKYYLNTNNFEEAFQHSCNVEFSADNFINNYAWYEVLDELVKNNINQTNTWLYQLLLLTLREHICVLSLAETPSGVSKSLVETNELLHVYDQALETVAKAGAPSGFTEFHTSLLQHHRGQFAFHAATFILKKAKKAQLSWKDANKISAPLMLIAWHNTPVDSTQQNWIKFAPEKLKNAVTRWFIESTYRCSQAGHYLITNYHEKNQLFLDQISQCFSGTHWKDKLYEKIFTNRTHLGKIKSSHFVSNAFDAPVIRLPRKKEVIAYDGDAQKHNGNSLHHFVWTVLNYKNYADFECTLFDMLPPSVNGCGPETLNKMDIYAFLYCAAITTKHKGNMSLYIESPDKPNILPASITDLLCTPSQMKWWDCAYKFSHNLLGTELTDIRATLSRGIEVVRCVDNHGLDAELLCMLGKIFSDRKKRTSSVDEKRFLESRAVLYYTSAIPLLEKLKRNIMIKVSSKRMFDYTHKELESRELNLLLEESKLYVAKNYINEYEYQKAVEVLANLKSASAYYYLALTHKKIAMEEINSSADGSKTKLFALLTKAKNYAYMTLEVLKNTEINENSPLNIDTHDLIEDLEVRLNKIEESVSDTDEKYSSDENTSYRSDILTINKNAYRNISSTPKAPSKANASNYRTAIDSQILEMTRTDNRQLERIENEIKNLQKRDTTMSDFIQQTKDWFEENRKLSNQIINTVNSNIQNTTDQFKLLKISVDQVKDQINECRNDCKDVVDLKKQIAALKKEVNKLKKSSSEQTLNETDLYSVDDEYKANENSSTYNPQLPFTAPIMPQFNPRPAFAVPPNPYQIYNQSLLNLYNQYSQFAQTSSLPGAAPLFDGSRNQMNFTGVYPTPDQMYLDIAHLIPTSVPVPPSMPASSSLSTMSGISTMPIVPTMPSVPIVTAPTTSVTSTNIKSESKEAGKPLPVNVVITSSDPLPTSVSAPAPILSVTIPPRHIKGTPHNYQIAMPASNDSKAMSPPVFNFSITDSKTTSTPTTSMPSWKQAFQSFGSEQLTYKNVYEGSSLDNSKSVVEGSFSETSPNVSLNKSRTYSEKSNTSVENYDPCPDFKPIVPLPAEVKVTTGEENETVIFSSRAKLFRYADNQWKERGLGEIKLLKHKITGKVRVLMRREQVLKICANHIITHEMEIKPMKNEVKAYFWVAHDYADETITLEKLCIRFKTAEIAKDFYNAFEKSRLESKPAPDHNLILKEKSTTQDLNPITPVKEEVSHGSTTHVQDKTVIGGFTFCGTPLFKSESNNNTNTVTNTDSQHGKTNVFSGLTFKTTGNSSFSHLLNTATSPGTVSSNSVKQDTNKNKLNLSDTVEEFEPAVEFKPVIPLPALIDRKTGEEDENVLFEHYAKLLRYDFVSKEWKERGLGNIKILVHKYNNQKVRLLMRRDQILKVCCNHAITSEMIFQKMPKIDKAVTWCAKDFSEGEQVAETFCLRFKTVDLCNEFMNTLKTAQDKIKDDTKAIKEEQNAAKQNQSGFGDKFKAKPGSWCCDGCYTNNLESFSKCACCEKPKPGADDSKPNNSTVPSSWGDLFKPKPGSWECQSCLVRNEVSKENCSACNAKNPSSTKPTTNIVAPNNSTKFNFGIVSQNLTSNIDQQSGVSDKMSSSGNGFGDNFKPKQGTWRCKLCFVLNEDNNENCCACSSTRDTTSCKTNTNLFDPSVSAVKFRFGMPPTPTTEAPPMSSAPSIFDGSGTHKFSFGIPRSNTAATDVSDSKFSATLFTGASKNIPKTQEEPTNLSIKKNDQSLSIGKPALLPTPQITSSSSFSSKESGTFGFVFKPAVASKSPAKSPNKSQQQESDEEEYVKEEDCKAQFNPVIPMPNKVEIVTGEENETELFAYRARLYRFMSGEWKERGTGIVKVLKHNETNKLRVVMRREQVLKICLNHALTSEITYSPKDEKCWVFAANDFSEGELSLQKFCLRFQNKDIALQFKDVVDKARQGKPIVAVSKLVQNTEADKDDDVTFVSELQASSEDKQKAKELMLPENFYTYVNRDPCKGCRGCNEEDTKSEATSSKKENQAIVSTQVSTSSPASISVSASTPIKINTTTFLSPSNSIYGTPGNMEKTFDNSIFRTPLGSIGSQTKSTTPNSNSQDTTPNATKKENIFAQKPSLFSNLVGQKSVFGTPQGSSTTSFGTSDSQISAKSSIIAPPKMSTSITPGESKASEAKSLFASAVKPVFGEASVFGNSETSSNKSIFGFSADKNKDDSTSEVKSIFGGGGQDSVNMFSGTSKGSLFGPGSLDLNLKPTISFGSGGNAFAPSATESNLFKPMFSNNTGHQTSIWNPAVTEQKPDVLAALNNKESQKSNEKNQPEAQELSLKLDSELSFAALSSGEPGFKKKDDFQWDGAGQQLFSSKSEDSKAKNSSGVGDVSVTEEDYDPHYEPIVPMPEVIVVTTGEEDEEKVYGERCKLYRYDEKLREWKERGVGELKILYHPQRNTYRLLLRREQVHKVVLNMLIFMELELLPLKNSDRAYTWVGLNYAETAAGDQETLAARFKTVDLSIAFRDQVVQCVRKLQAAAAKAIREERESSEIPSSGVAPLRLPKHLTDSARADTQIAAATSPTIQDTASQNPDESQKPSLTFKFEMPLKPNGQTQDEAKSTTQTDLTQLQKRQNEEEIVEEEENEDEEDEDYYQYDQHYYDDYYNEDDDENAYYKCEGEVVIHQGGEETASCPHAQIQVLYDPENFSPKILVTDANTGETLTDMLIHTDTEFQMCGDSCSWSGTDYTTNEPAIKEITINFYDSDTAMKFYDSCETSKATTCCSNDPES